MAHILPETPPQTIPKEVLRVLGAQVSARIILYLAPPCALAG